MRLASLNPMLTYSGTVAGYDSSFGYTHQLSLDCPACGSPYRLVINVVLGPPPGRSGVWGLTLPPEPKGDGWDGVTMQPSFQNHDHGRKKPCGVHLSIINGEVCP